MAERVNMAAADHCQLMAASFSVTSSSSKEGSSCSNSTSFLAPSLFVCPSPLSFQVYLASGLLLLVYLGQFLQVPLFHFPPAHSK